MKEKIIETLREAPKFFQDKEAERFAEGLYDNNLPYHNFTGHVKSTLENGKAIIEKCRNKGVPINEKVVYYANLFHDAGYQEDNKKKGFDSKEDYSAHLAGQYLKKIDMDEKTIKEVLSSILATHKDKPFITNEEKAVRASDLADMAKDYNLFLANAVKLKKEMEMTRGERISWLEWKNDVKKTIKFYLDQDIRLTRPTSEENGNSNWHKKTKENLEKFINEDIELTS